MSVPPVREKRGGTQRSPPKAWGGSHRQSSIVMDIEVELVLSLRWSGEESEGVTERERERKRE